MTDCEKDKSTPFRVKVLKLLTRIDSLWHFLRVVNGSCRPCLEKLVPPNASHTPGIFAPLFLGTRRALRRVAIERCNRSKTTSCDVTLM